jgi:4-alpha-glucanotransferase
MSHLNPDLLHRLSEAYGIYHGYHELSGHYVQASDATKIAQLQALGLNTKDDAALKQALEAVAAEAAHLLPATLVIRQSDSAKIPLRHMAQCAMHWSLLLEGGGGLSGEIAAGATALRTGKSLLPLGYHHLRLEGEAPQECHLIVVPERCKSLADVTGGDRTWGLTAPLYGLRSARNWGIGDFEDLARLAEAAAPEGADFIGFNPVHALFPAASHMYSPYSPSSREFLNVMHIAPDMLEEFSVTEEGAKALKELVNSKPYTAARAAELVDYAAVYALKTRAFEAAFDLFERHASIDRKAAFEAFCHKKGASLAAHAAYELIFEEQVAKDPAATSWRDWPEALQSPGKDAVQAILRHRADRVRFYQYLQWVAHTQLEGAQNRACTAGMRIGLYLDLAVGMVPGGAEAWAEPSSVVHGMSLGAPGDAANPDGQKWNLAPLDPIALKHEGFRVFRRTLAEVMRPAGLVRIDHILGLNRAFWCPLDDAAPGNYVAYPREEMLGIIALESQRHSCIVVGEDLGTVPEGFRERLSDWGLLGCAILYFEREGDSFTPPGHYGEDKFASLNNHDFPTLKGFWEGEDFRWRAALGIGASRLEADRNARLHDRWLMLRRLEDEGLLPDGISPYAAPAEMSDDLAAAIHQLLARVKSSVVAVQLEDLLGLKGQPNVPGTTVEEPNWRRKLPVSIENLFDQSLSGRILSAMRAERPR